MSFPTFLQTHRLDQFLERMVEYGADSLEDWIQYTPEEFEEAVFMFSANLDAPHPPQ